MFSVASNVASGPANTSTGSFALSSNAPLTFVGASSESIEVEEVEYQSDEDGQLTPFAIVDGEPQPIQPLQLADECLDHCIYGSEDTHTIDCFSSILPCFGSCVTRARAQSSSKTSTTSTTSRSDGSSLSGARAWFAKTKNQLARTLLQEQRNTGTGSSKLKRKAYTRLGDSLKDKQS